MSNVILNKDDLIEINQIKTTITIVLSIFNLGIYFCSLVFTCFYIKNTIYIKSKSFSFILINSLTGLINYFLFKNNALPKVMFNYISYIIQFHLIFSSINKILSGQYLFKNDKDFSIKKISLIEFFIFPIIVFPYSFLFRINYIIFDVLQNIIIIISIIYFYSYVKKHIYAVLYFLKENSKDVIIISNMDLKELLRIYEVTYNLWSILFYFSLFYYIIRLLFLLLINKNIFIHLITSLLLITIELATVLILFYIFTYINCLINKYYNQNDNETESFGDKKKSRINYKYNYLDNYHYEENTIIKIDDISDDTENKNKEEENSDLIDLKKIMKFRISKKQ